MNNTSILGGSRDNKYKGAQLGVIAVQSCVIFTIFVLTIFTNGLLCAIFYRRPHLLTASHSFVLNLACIGIGELQCVIFSYY